MTKKVLFILMPQDYRDEEFFDPYHILKGKKFEITVAGFKPGNAVGANGETFTVDTVIDQLSHDDLATYDALVIPGGPGSIKYLWNNKELQKIILYFYENNKIIAGICYAVIPLVESGILTGKNATVYPTNEAKEILEKYDVTFVPDGCVTLEQEKIITAQGPAFAKNFGDTIASMLE
jgi:protease I